MLRSLEHPVTTLDFSGRLLFLTEDPDRVHAQLSERLHRDLPMVALLQYPTVRSLAQHLAGGSDATAAADATMNRARQQRAAYARHRDLARKG